MVSIGGLSIQSKLKYSVISFSASVIKLQKLKTGSNYLLNGRLEVVTDLDKLYLGYYMEN